MKIFFTIGIVSLYFPFFLNLQAQIGYQDSLRKEHKHAFSTKNGRKCDQAPHMMMGGACLELAMEDMEEEVLLQHQEEGLLNEGIEGASTAHIEANSHISERIRHGNIAIEASNPMGNQVVSNAPLKKKEQCKESANRVQQEAKKAYEDGTIRLKMDFDKTENYFKKAADAWEKVVEAQSIEDQEIAGMWMQVAKQFELVGEEYEEKGRAFQSNRQNEVSYYEEHIEIAKKRASSYREQVQCLLQKRRFQQEAKESLVIIYQSMLGQYSKVIECWQFADNAYMKEKAEDYKRWAQSIDACYTIVNILKAHAQFLQDTSVSNNQVLKKAIAEEYNKLIVQYEETVQDRIKIAEITPELTDLKELKSKTLRAAARREKYSRRSTSSWNWLFQCFNKKVSPEGTPQDQAIEALTQEITTLEQAIATRKDNIINVLTLKVDALKEKLKALISSSNCEQEAKGLIQQASQHDATEGLEANQFSQAHTRYQQEAVRYYQNAAKLYQESAQQWNDSVVAIDQGDLQGAEGKSRAARKKTKEAVQLIRVCASDSEDDSSTM